MLVNFAKYRAFKSTQFTCKLTSVQCCLIFSRFRRHFYCKSQPHHYAQRFHDAFMTNRVNQLHAYSQVYFDYTQGNNNNNTLTRLIPHRLFLHRQKPSACSKTVRTMSTSSKNSTSKTASQMYQRLSQLEHVLKRPDTYIGSVEFHESSMWVCDAEGHMACKTVRIVPGLYKIFDEILVNAADNKVNDPGMKNLKVEIDKENLTISVFNDGRGIPIEMHEKENMYVPELIFGNLLTSSNYDDDEQKVTGGRNGFGAKLCNIFSNEFILETGNGKQYYKQVWTDNMGKVNPPEISKSSAKSFTKVTFKPDLSRFGMTTFDDDFVSVLRRRVYDITGTVKGITVTLNGDVIPIKTFKGYVEMMVKSMNENDESSNVKILHANPNDRWEVAFALSDGNGFQQMSFVNSIATTSGGTHVEHVADQISKYVVENASKGTKVGKLQKAQVRNNMFVFVNCKITNPSFSSQTKEQLTTKVSQFGSKCELSDKFLKDCYKSTGLDERLTSISERNAANALKKQDGGKRQRLTQYPKLTDATKAGTREAHKCTLILCEGDSASNMAAKGLAVVGYEYFGCFPLRGKVLNVRDASHDQVMKNAEIKALKQIIGLQHKKEYTSVQGLRYGHVMIMTDQDHDGSHIKGLLINFFESSFPGLLDIPGFLQEFITPIVKVTIESGSRKGEQIPFYSMPEYEFWRDTEGKALKKWRLKYYKGLGTSETHEMKQYFADIQKHEKTFETLQGNDKENIELVFSKTRADERKIWLQGFQPGTYLDQSVDTIPISEFINKELILFSMADNVRSIPSVVDGLKPGQRKIMWVCLERLHKETKVQSLAGIVTMRAQYHHGEASLSQTIIALAQDFVGANNLYWLMPIGGFGSRVSGGKDASSGRYISTNVTPITRTVFSKLDAPILNYMQEDESTVEPEYFVPILPSLLVNGSEGIGTGWSTNIPAYNPMDLVDNLRRMMDDLPLKPLTPWFRGWTGQIEKVPGSEHQWRVCGRIEEVDDSTLAITELPIKMWNVTFKEFLNKCVRGNYRSAEGVSEKEREKLSSGEFIEDFYEEHGDYLRFIIKLRPEDMRKVKQAGLYKTFKLIANVTTSNMVAFDPQGRLRKYNTPEEILKDFYHVRLDFYRKRRDFAIEQLKYELEMISQRARFIKMIIEQDLVVSNKKKKVLEEELRNLRFPMFINTSGQPYWPDQITDDIKSEIQNAPDDQDDETELNAAMGIDDGDNSVKGRIKPPSYDYLLNMNIISLTRERYERLIRERGDCEDRLNTLLSTTIKDIWKSELDKFATEWEEFLKMDHERRLGEVVLPNKPNDGGGSGGQGRKRKAKREQGSSKRVARYNESTIIEPPPIEESVTKPRAATRVKKESPSSSTSETGTRKSRVAVKKEIDNAADTPMGSVTDSSDSASSSSSTTTTSAEKPSKKAAAKKAPAKKASAEKTPATDASIAETPTNESPARPARRTQRRKSPVFVDVDDDDVEMSNAEESDGDDDLFQLSD